MVKIYSERRCALKVGPYWGKEGRRKGESLEGVLRGGSWEESIICGFEKVRLGRWWLESWSGLTEDEGMVAKWPE